MIRPAAVVHTSILAPPEDVVAFLSDMEKWKTWAPWIRSVTRASAREWMLDTDAGRMEVRFVAANDFGVLDHQVTLESGGTVLNGMRVLPNGTGSELVMVLFQSPQMSTQEFERDLQAVTDDLARLKQAAETMTRKRSPEANQT